MKFMKLGSKPDSFRTDDNNNIRYVTSELASDIIVVIGDAKFYLHKFPLLSKCARLQKSVINTNQENCDEVDISDIPSGPAAFELCAKFCYGMTVTLNAYNVVSARCAAEYLGMHETVEKENLIYKIDVFISSSIFRCWKDSVIVLQTTKSSLPLTEELKIVSQCIDSITTKACVDTSEVVWSYSYNRKKLPQEYGNDNGVRTRQVPQDWWVEDLCDVEIDLYKRIIVNIKAKEILSNEVIGEALKAYAHRGLPGFSKGIIQSRDVVKYQSTVDSIVWLLPDEKSCVSCGFLLKLLKAAILVDSGDMVKGLLVKKIGQQLEEASVNDLLITASEIEKTSMYDVETVKKIVKEFLTRDQNAEIESPENALDIQEIRTPGILSDASKLMVSKLIDGYLTEIAKDPNLPLETFINLFEMVSGTSRPCHGGIYWAIDMHLMVHPGMSKSERKRICRLMDCKKLSAEACMHAVQNERLPLRVIVQVLFFEQVRMAASSGCSTPDLPSGLKDLNSGSSRSAATTNPDDEWDTMATSEELKALRGELATLRIRNGIQGRNSVDRAVFSKVKGLLNSKRMLTKLWSSKGGQVENSGSDSSESLGSANQEEAKSTPSRNRRYSVS